MRVDRIAMTHHLDTSEVDVDGLYDWRYGYDVLTVRAGELIVEARSYTDEVGVVSLLTFRVNGAVVGQGDAERQWMDEVCAVAAFLRASGYPTVQWLAGGSYLDASC